ncbi:chitin synthase (Chitin-UDP-GlcNac-transferase) [Thraustotheca clavata]|uniref:chitin synthase n=1 Tax=Thraustotheca clavata TaxID=74557 RepID=A0A1V9Z9M3_9STRA|nr:chitin synthase (Chitin-UDP-GlcNac-transferase) [Thraustotheca clavata]
MSDKLDLTARLRALREGNTPAEAPNTQQTQRPRPLYTQDSLEFGGMYATGSPVGAEASDSSFAQVPVWKDSKETKSYLDDEPTPQPASLLNMASNLVQRQASNQSFLRQNTANFRPLPNTVEELLDGAPTYESAFRLVQLAVQMEQDGDPVAAINLYVDAGTTLVEVGKREVDPLLQKGIQQKAHELLQRAEDLDKWMNTVAEEARKAALPPQLKIARTNVPTVQNAWNGRTPPFHDADEFRLMRYTAVATKDPIQFTNDGYVLRVHQLQRNIKVFITITMYNEEGSELLGTLTGLAKGLAYMCKEYGANFWQQVAVAVVSDGRTKASKTCLEYLNGLGAFDEEIMTVTSLGVDVQMHLFESTLQLVENLNFENYYPPLQLIYALKENNGGKLNSHLWFFNAFSEQLNPKYTVLVDVGTIPAETSVFRLIRSMERNYQIGGVAGEIAVEKPNYFNPVIAAQHFEYKISNIMDKSLESVFGFISVLPGAFSAYRYEAIRAVKGVGPLPEYFKSLTSTTKELGPFQGNMYLAEDRILCFELLARKNKQWTMHYVKDAIARTDVPETLVDLIKQRRRWLNGSFFAGLFAIGHFSRVWSQSSHSLGRKLVFTFQFFYLALQNLLSWFLLSNLFLTFYFVLTLAFTDSAPALLQAMLTIYLAIVGGLIVFALGNKPEPRTASFYLFSCLYMGIIMMLVTGISIYGLVGKGVSSVKDPRNITGALGNCTVSEGELVGGVVSSLGLIFLSAFVHGEFNVLLSTIQYFFMLPTFVNVLGIYAYSNLHDLSWGTKGLESGGGHGPTKSGNGNVKDVVEQQKKLEAIRQAAAKEKEDVDNSFRAFRSTLLMAWLTTNGIWLYFVTDYMSSGCYLKGLSYAVGFFNVIRFTGCVIFIIFRIIRRFGLNCCTNGAANDTFERNLPPDWQTHYNVQNQGNGRVLMPRTDSQVPTTPRSAAAIAATAGAVALSIVRSNREQQEEVKQHSIIVIDIGSSSVRASAYVFLNDEWICIKGSLHQHTMQALSADGTANFQAIRSAVERVVDATLQWLNGKGGFNVVALGFSSFAMSFVGVNEGGTPVTRVYTYAGQSSVQAAELQELLQGQAAETYNRTGCPIHPAYAAPQLFKQKDKVHRWQSVVGAILTAWTDEQVPMSYSEASWTGLFNFRELQWDEKLLKLIQLDPSTMPNIQDPSISIGGLNKKYTRRWPLLNNAEIYLALADGAAANIGSKCSISSRIGLTIGTSAAMRVMFPIEKISNQKVPKGLWCYRVDSEHVLLGGALTDGGSLYQWGQKMHSLPTDFPKQLAAMPPASHGLIILPFLHGERAPGWHPKATCTISGINAATTPVHIMRATLESVAFRLAAIYSLLSPYASNDATIVASGTALTASAIWRQIIADAIGRRVSLEVDAVETTSRGVAMYIGALNGLGSIKQPPALSSSTVDATPVLQAHSVYLSARQEQEDLYHKLYD